MWLGTGFLGDKKLKNVFLKIWQNRQKVVKTQGGEEIPQKGVKIFTNAFFMPGQIKLKLDNEESSRIVETL